jgi:hypothetical protein
MTKYIPSKLYKYQTCNSHSLEHLSNKTIRFSKPEQLNDPFDFTVPYHLAEPTPGELEAAYKKSVDQLGDKDKKAEADACYLTQGIPNEKWKAKVMEIGEIGWQKKVQELSQMGVACFSERVDHILMWSHYANGHRGFCLEFDTRFDPFRDTEKVHQVIYSNLYPSIKATDPVLLPELSIIPLITKSLHWHYEEEWRMIIDNGDTNYKYDPRALTRIYFGCAMSDEEKNKIISIIDTSSTTLYNMQRSDREFKLQTHKRSS